MLTLEDKIDMNAAVRRIFPHAVDAKLFTARVAEVISADGIKSNKVLLGFSTCPDEINRVVTAFHAHYGAKQFPLGGLTGIPFTGETGFRAYAHHVAVHGGALLVLYGPHIGISDDGAPGKVIREGQEDESTTCGAAMAFLEKIQSAAKKSRQYSPSARPLDMQQAAFEMLMLPFSERIVSAEEPAVELTNLNYEVINMQIHQILESVIQGIHSPIYLAGGIMINTSPGNTQYFEPRHFQKFEHGNMKDLIAKVDQWHRK